VGVRFMRPVIELQLPVSTQGLTSNGSALFRSDALIKHRNIDEPVGHRPRIGRPTQHRSEGGPYAYLRAGFRVDACQLRGVMSRHHGSPSIDA